MSEPMHCPGCCGRVPPIDQDSFYEGVQCPCEGVVCPTCAALAPLLATAKEMSEWIILVWRDNLGRPISYECRRCGAEAPSREKIKHYDWCFGIRFTALEGK